MSLFTNDTAVPPNEETRRMKPKCFGKNNCVNIRWYKCEFSKGCLDEWEEGLHNSNKSGEENE